MFYKLIKLMFYDGQCIVGVIFLCCVPWPMSSWNGKAESQASGGPTSWQSRLRPKLLILIPLSFHSCSCHPVCSKPFCTIGYVFWRLIFPRVLNLPHYSYFPELEYCKSVLCHSCFSLTFRCVCCVVTIVIIKNRINLGNFWKSIRF